LSETPKKETHKSLSLNNKEILLASKTGKLTANTIFWIKSILLIRVVLCSWWGTGAS